MLSACRPQGRIPGSNGSAPLLSPPPNPSYSGLFSGRHCQDAMRHRPVGQYPDRAAALGPEGNQLSTGYSPKGQGERGDTGGKGRGLGEGSPPPQKIRNWVGFNVLPYAMQRVTALQM